VIDFLLEVFVLKQDGIDIPLVLILKFIIRGIDSLLALILLVLIKEQSGNFVINLLNRFINISVLVQIFLFPQASPASGGCYGRVRRPGGLSTRQDSNGQADPAPGPQTL